MERLYEFIESFLPKDYEIYYQTLEENKHSQIGIFLYQGEADKETLDGNCLYESVKCHIEINCNKSENALIKALDNIRKFCIDIKDSTSNIEGLDIVDIQILNKSIPIGKNEHGIQKVVSNLNIKYNLEVN